jgi:fatty-acid desaturase
MDKIEKAQYKNLRSGFNYMVGVVLGEGWYNYEHDVYQSDTETIRCMIVKFRKYEDDITKYKILACISSVAFFILLGFVVIF